MVPSTKLGNLDRLYCNKYALERGVMNSTITIIFINSGNNPLALVSIRFHRLPFMSSDSIFWKPFSSSWRSFPIKCTSLDVLFVPFCSLKMVTMVHRIVHLGEYVVPGNICALRRVIVLWMGMKTPPSIATYLHNKAVFTIP